MSTGGPPFGAYNAPSNPNNVTTYGQALLNTGLCQITQVNGVGLVTRGLCWVAGEIWFDAIAAKPITTSWTDIAGPTLTTWTPAVDFGMAEYSF